MEKTLLNIEHRLAAVEKLLKVEGTGATALQQGSAGTATDAASSGGGSSGKQSLGLRLARIRDSIEKEYGTSLYAVDKKLRSLETLSVIRLSAVELPSLDEPQSTQRVKQLTEENAGAKGEEGQPIRFEVVDPVIQQQRIGTLLAAPIEDIHSYRHKVSLLNADLHQYLNGKSSTASTLTAVLREVSERGPLFEAQQRNAVRLVALQERLESVASDMKLVAEYANEQIRAWDLAIHLKESGKTVGDLLDDE